MVCRLQLKYVTNIKVLYSGPKFYACFPKVKKDKLSTLYSTTGSVELAFFVNNKNVILPVGKIRLIIYRKSHTYSMCSSAGPLNLCRYFFKQRLYFSTIALIFRSLVCALEEIKKYYFLR